MEEQSPKQHKTVEGKSEGTATPEISEKTFENTIGSEKINHLTTITEKAKAKSILVSSFNAVIRKFRYRTIY